MKKWLWHALWLIPLFLLLECAVRPVSEPDIFFYFALVETYLKTGHWPVTDPFVYTLPGDKLMTLHQWLGYWVFYSLYPLMGWAGPILLTAFFILVLISLPLLPFVWRRREPPVYFPLLWTVAVFGAHHRFRERVSLFGDLFTVCLAAGLYWCAERRWFWRLLPVLFLVWAQMHPSYPLGWVILIAYAVLFRAWTWPRERLVCLGLCFVAPFLNPMGVEGVIYPFSFSWNVEPFLRQYIVEWLSLADPRLYEFRFLYLPFVTLIPFGLWVLWREWSHRRLRLWDGFVFVLGLALLIKSVRFGMMAHGLLLVWFAATELRRPIEEQPRWLAGWISLGACAVLSCLVVAVKIGMSPTSLQPISSRFRVDTSYFPEAAVNVLNRNMPHMHIFHSFGYGGYLAWRWQGNPPIFFHGFSTNFKFYEDNYYFPQESRAKLDAVIAKWDIGVFLLSKLGNDNNFIEILARHPDWQLIYQDRACVIFAKRDKRVFGTP